MRRLGVGWGTQRHRRHPPACRPAAGAPAANAYMLACELWSSAAKSWQHNGEGKHNGQLVLCGALCTECVLASIGPKKGAWVGFAAGEAGRGSGGHGHRHTHSHKARGAWR